MDDSAGEVIENKVHAWEGTGWPNQLVADQKILANNSFICGRKECRHLLRDAWQLNCGHRYCEQCLKVISGRPLMDQVCIPCVLEEENDDLVYTNAKTDNAPWPEPYQVSEQHKQLFTIDATKAFKDQLKDKEVGKVLLKCPWGCSNEKNQLTKVQVKNLLDHMKTCKSRQIACDKCGEKLEQRYKQHHMDSQCLYRTVSCPHGCLTKNILAKDLQAHKYTCTEKPEVCRICSQDIQGSLHEHMKRCFALCPFGCENGKRYQIVEHLADPSFQSHHLIQLALEVGRVRGGDPRGHDHEDEGSRGPHSKRIPIQEKSILDKLLDVEEKEEKSAQQMKDTLDKLSSQPLEERQDTIKRVLSDVEALAGCKSPIEELHQGVRKLVGSMQKLSVNEEIFGEMVKSVSTQETQMKSKLRSLEAGCEFREAAISENYLQLRQLSRAGYNGILIWRVDNVSKLREKAKDGTRYSIFSEPFYTDKYEYKMCLRLYLNGDGNGKNTHISLFFVVMKGLFDATLKWPFANKVVMSLLNQKQPPTDPISEKFRPDRNSSSFARPKDDKNIASGCPQFAPQERVFNQSNGFLKDDTLFFKCDVEKLQDVTYQE